MEMDERIHQKIHSLLDTGDLDVAKWMLDKLLDDYPDDARAHHERAILAHRNGDTARAGQHFLSAVELSPNDPVYLKSLGDFYYVVEGKADAAVTQYERVLAIVPDDEETLLTAAHLCVCLQQLDQARNYYQRVLTIDPDHVECRSILERLNSKTVAPDHQIQPELLYQEACRLAGEGNRQDAVATLEQVVKADPEHAQAHNDLGVLYYELADKAQAFQHYERSVALAPGNTTFQKNRADFLLMERNDGKAALRGYIEALKADPRDIEAHLGCARICIANGKLDDARDFIDCAMTVEPWNQDANGLLSQLENSVYSSDPQSDPDAFYQSAQSKRAAGDYQGAIEDLNILLQQTPDFSAAYNDLGVLYYETGDKSRAQESYEKSLELDPDQPNVLKNLADFYLVEQKRIEDAMRLYLKALEKNQEDIECLLAIGYICTILGKHDDAVDFYHRVLDIEPWNHTATEALNKLDGSKIPNEIPAGNNRALG
jgi:tetratricopeptide (TPR) repeat protein